MHAAELVGGLSRAPSVLSDPRHFAFSFFFFFSLSKKGRENKIKMIHRSGKKKIKSLIQLPYLTFIKLILSLGFMSGELLFYAWESSNYFSLRSLSFINKTPLRPHRSFTIWKPPNASNHMLSKVPSLLPEVAHECLCNAGERSLPFQELFSASVGSGKGGRRKTKSQNENRSLHDWCRKEILITACAMPSSSD